MAKVLAFPQLVQQPVVQTRGPGRRPKSISNIRRILFDRKLAETHARVDRELAERRAKAEQADQELTKRVTLNIFLARDRMIIEDRGDGTWGISLEGIYAADPELACRVLKQSAPDIEKAYEIERPMLCQVHPFVVSGREVRHG